MGGNGRHFQYLIAFSLFLLCFNFKGCYGEVGCIEREREALLHFKQGVIDDYYGALSSWGKGDCCKWNGVECNNQTGHVITLDLHDLALGGILPTQLGNLSNLQSLDLGSNYLHMTCENLDWLSGLPLLTYLDLSEVDLSKAIHWPQAFNKMPSLTELYLRYTQLRPTVSISQINSSTSLVVLDLAWNGWYGLTSPMYPWLFNFSTSLGHLDLSYNQLNGSIPDALGTMISLTYLDLSSNQLEGEITKSLRYLCNLETLYLSRNNLTGLLEKDFLACSNGTLKHLDLSFNRFKGTSFPQLSGFSQLRELRIGFNQLNGTLDESFGQLPQLRVLSIPSNSLLGTVSENHLFGLSKLEYLDLSFNSFTFNISLDQVPRFQAKQIMLASCKLGPRFPSWLQTQKLLDKLDISASGIADVIPNWFWNLTSNLYWLNISNNHISGTLPNLTSYSFDLGMDMSSNFLEGSIPQSVFNAGWLDLSKNMFSGSVSLSCRMITNELDFGLSHLDLSSNRLSGELPKSWECWRDLIVLNLANNNFSGKIKNSIGLLYRMQTLHLRNNSLTGALPLSLQNCGNLRLVDLGKNKLSGRIPAWIGDSLSDLIVLNLRSNEFNGSIPLNLCQLKKIQMLDLSGNNLSGKIPKCLKHLTAMSSKESSDISFDEQVFMMVFTYVDNTLVQWKGKELEYKNTLWLIKSIDFSSNNLIGGIPIEVTDLVELVSLNFSRNNLTGPIPATIGQLKWLDFLDLSQNRLQGEIPDSLSQIAGLSVLDLSNNTLSGKIPSGTQLQSFSASTYEGNLGLCGPPLLKKCQEDEHGDVSFTSHSRKKEDSKDDANDIWFYGSIALGFIIGFWGVCGTLLFNTSWRYAYFQFLSRIKDWLYVTTIVSMNIIRRSLQS